ncbi:MAG: sulfatase-like hydrolase/transferase, partial [Rubripirellula sp.]
PNVVLIISDDQKYSDFGFMGHEAVQTPNLDRLARDAATYPNGYVPSSVCRPSLVTLLTGLYPHQHGVHFNHPPPGFAKLTKSPEIGKAEFDHKRERGAELITLVPTLPRLMAAQGYRCFQTGKYWEGHWRNAGFTEGMTIAEPSGGPYGDKQLANGEWVAHGNGDHGLAIGRQTMQPIEDFLDDVEQTPFLLWYAPFLPHTPHDSPQRFFDLYSADERVAKHEIPYFAAISQFDDTVGQLMDSIARRGLTDNTLFVFVVDNGWEPDVERYVAHRQEWDHTKQSKRSPFDAGLRTPILLSWQGVIQRGTHLAPVSSVDLVPTILSATTLTVPNAKFPGRDLWASATGAKTLSDQVPIFGELYPGDASVLREPARDVAYRWIRQGHHKLIVPRRSGGSAPWNGYLMAPALYDVVEDPNERINRISDPALATITRTLTTTLDRWWSPDR